jgi:hypothetical protein
MANPGSGQGRGFGLQPIPPFRFLAISSAVSPPRLIRAAQAPVIQEVTGAACCQRFRFSCSR